MSGDWRPDGLDLLLDFIAPHREEEVVAMARKAIDICRSDPLHPKQLKHVPRRRYAHFGFSYDYSQVRFDAAPLVPVRPVPDPLEALAREVRAVLGVSDEFDSIAVNEYHAGEGIHPHVDSSNLAEVIAIVSVGEACVTIFKSESRVFSLAVPRRSLLVMRGQARCECSHEVEVDLALKRTRYSIVFRSRA